VKKKEYLKIVDSLGFDKKEFCIISGGTMIMYGLKNETEDVDLKITWKLFNEIKSKYNLKVSDKMPGLYELGDSIE
jgi:hypothetical protein